MRFILVLCVLLISGFPAVARCVGEDLLRQMPAETRLGLEARAHAQPYATGNFWRASRNGQHIDIIGTYHMPDARHSAAVAYAKHLLQDMPALLVEAGPTEMEALKLEVTRRPDFMFTISGPTLPELLAPEEWAAVAAAASARGVPAFMAAKMRPWYLATLLAVPGCALDSLRAEGAVGLDQQIIETAEVLGRPIEALEPFDTMFSLFAALSPRQELDMVRAYLAMETHPEDLMATLANAYFRGESRLIWEFTLFEAQNAPGFDPTETQALYDLMEDILMTRRNIAWIPVLETAAQRHGKVLAAFGALHLPGTSGVLALLEARGWKISPVTLP